MYRPLQSTGGRGTSSTTSLMPKKGINLRELAQLLKPENALVITNYILSADGGLPKREGYSTYIDKQDTNAVTAIEDWEGYIVFGWGGNGGLYSLSAYKKDTGVFTDIKTDFSSPITSLDRYGAYLIVASPDYKVGRVTLELAYDAQTANFTTGLLITGGTSGATAKIQEDSDGGASGTLTLGEINGVFQDNELITDSSTGSADVNGVISFVFTEIADAPKARIIKVMDRRCFATDLEEDEASVRYSYIDNGTNPPFNNWSVSTLSTSGGLITFKNGGKGRSFEKFGNIFLVYYENGRIGFTIDQIDSGGTISKKDSVIYERNDSGATASAQTRKGIIYTNNQGIWQTVSIGQGDIKFSEQEILTTSILGNDFFEKANFDDADIIEDEERNLILITYREDSLKNNRILCFNTDFNGYSIFKGWNISKFLRIGKDFYGASSNQGKVYKLFDGYDDDGKDINCEMVQELGVGDLNAKKDMIGQYCHGKLSSGTEIQISFDIFDRTGRFIKEKLKMTWVPSRGLVEQNEYGSTPYGGSYGGGPSGTGLIESYAGARKVIRNFQRIRLRIFESSKLPHEINYFTIETRQKAKIRIRNLQ